MDSCRTQHCNTSVAEHWLQATRVTAVGESLTRQPGDSSSAWSVALAALAFPSAGAHSRFGLVQETLPTAAPPGRLACVVLVPPHRTFSTSTAPTRCRDWPPRIRSFSLALASPARRRRRKYLSARAARVSKQVTIALVARAACPSRIASPETRLDSSFT
jgi:hypothetical protein